MIRLVAAVSLTPNKNQPKQTTVAEIKKVGRYENAMKNKLAAIIDTVAKGFRPKRSTILPLVILPTVYKLEPIKIKIEASSNDIWNHSL